jgi:hypothetical protein
MFMILAAIIGLTGGAALITPLPGAVSLDIQVEP